MTEEITKFARRSGGRYVFVRGDELVLQSKDGKKKPVPDGRWKFPGGSIVTIKDHKITDISALTNKVVAGKLGPKASDWDEVWQEGTHFSEAGWDEYPDEEWWLWSEGEAHAGPQQTLPTHPANVADALRKASDGLAQARRQLPGIKELAGQPFAKLRR